MKPILAETTSFFRAGWQVADVLHALETRPDGSGYKTSGAGGMRSIQAWLRLRLAAWSTSEGPMLAPSIRYDQAEQQRKARQAQQRAEEQRNRSKSAPKNSPARLLIRRKAAIVRCGSEQAARHQHPELFTMETS